MGDWGARAHHSAFVAGIGVDTATSAVTTTGTANANTKTAWSELTSGVTYATAGIWLHLNHGTNNGYWLAVDLGIGAAGSETVIVPNLVIYANAWNFYGWLYVPITLPASTRVAVRIQSSTGTRALIVSAVLDAAGHLGARSASVITAYGVTTSGATVSASVDPGASANTKTAVEITSSTTRAAEGFLVAVTNKDVTLGANTSWLMDICVGAAGAEVAIASNLGMYASPSTDSIGVGTIWLGPFWIPIPESTRLSAAVQSNVTDASDRVLGVAIYTLS